ncbi:P27 family phage terminase small subunit [Chromobacterium sp. TRC.1.1.SA]|uniref:P27 family phage terminase small subunit n=1 Tax=Chromobacterium indicum TaxID=3110228 RepID=A0ABV0CEP0_9NEIS
MDDRRPPLTVISGGVGGVARNAGDNGAIKSPSTPPGAKLSPRERKVWDEICDSLRAAGMEHLTAGLAISVICRTFIRLQDAEEELSKVIERNGGSYVIDVGKDKPYFQAHPIYSITVSLKEELRKWLPESCLTLPSAAAVKAKLGDKAPQDDLFDSAVNLARRHPSAGSG